VEFYDGPALLGTDIASPFQFDWNAVPAGLHTLTARALDSLGGMATSAPVTLTGNILPVTALTNPAPATRIVLTEPITLAATASDGDGSITQVEFRANGLTIGADPTAPYTAEWTNSVLGAHTLVCVATDNSGMSRTSAPVAVEVLLRPKLTPIWLTNRSYLIQSSTNLLQWLPLSTNVATNGAFTIEDTSVTNAPPRRYYRAVP
jgi:hypothetical protein